MKKRVLLTGASGFIGRHALPFLAELDFEIHAITNRKDLETDIDVILHKTNILDHDRTRDLVNQIRPSHMLHLAWYAVPGKYQSANENIDWVSASLSLLDAFRNSGGKRVVIAGTCFEYSWDNGICDEYNTPRTPSTLYGTCKNSLALSVDDYSKQHDISSAWGRIFHLYGPHEAPERLVPSVIRAILMGKDAKCTHGRQIRDFSYVSDIAGALVALLDSDTEGPVNIASGSPITIGELVTKIGRMLGKEDLIKLGSWPANESDAMEVTANVSRLRNEVGWQNKYDIESGLTETIAWHRRNISIS